MKRKKNLFTVSSIYSVQMLTASPQYRLTSTQLIGSKCLLLLYSHALC